MFDYNYTSSKVHAPGALEVAIRARMMEKKLALLSAEYRAEAAADVRGYNSPLRALIMGLLTGLR